MKKAKYGYIYLVINLINGLKYVGKKKGEFSPYYFGSGIFVNRAIKKYGKISFKIEPIDHAFTKEGLNEKEKYWIKQHVCICPKGYNLTEGGDGGDLLTHHPDREEIIRKSSQSRKGLKRLSFSKEWKENMRLAHLGKKRNPHTEETKLRMRHSHKNIKGIGIHKSACPCCCCKSKRGEIKGKNHPLFNTHRSQETKDKIRETLFRHRSQ